MSLPRPANTPSASTIDADGVRRIRTAPPARAWPLVLAVAVLAGAGIAIGFGLVGSDDGPTAAIIPPLGPGATGVASSTAVVAAPPSTRERGAAQRRSLASMQPTAASSALDDAVSGDPNDLASHFAPGDPVPTAAEVIQALNDAGDHTGIGAFNPPGTSPPLRGLAVPEAFVLPPGYVRHHQVTDQGEPLEPILMFSPDHVLRDAAGRPIALPDDLVVPPELAPPGLPLRPIDVPPQ
jgi:hypothetical protein